MLIEDNKDKLKIFITFKMSSFKITLLEEEEQRRILKQNEVSFAGLDFLNLSSGGNFLGPAGPQGATGPTGASLVGPTGATGVAGPTIQGSPFNQANEVLIGSVRLNNSVAVTGIANISGNYHYLKVLLSYEMNPALGVAVRLSNTFPAGIVLAQNQYERTGGSIAGAYATLSTQLALNQGMPGGTQYGTFNFIFYIMNYQHTGMYKTVFCPQSTYRNHGSLFFSSTPVKAHTFRSFIPLNNIILSSSALSVGTELHVYGGI